MNIPLWPANMEILSQDMQNAFNLINSDFQTFINTLFFSSNTTVILSGLQVQANATPDGGITVTAGVAVQNGQIINIATNQQVNVISGTYTWGTPLGADTTNPRIDLIVCQYQTQATNVQSRPFKDPTTGTVTNQNVALTQQDYFALNVIHGTPSANPVAPAVPSGWFALAQVYVAAGATVIQQANITDLTAQYRTSGGWLKKVSGGRIWINDSAAAEIDTMPGIKFFLGSTAYLLDNTAAGYLDILGNSNGVRLLSTLTANAGIVLPSGQMFTNNGTIQGGTIQPNSLGSFVVPAANLPLSNTTPASESAGATGTAGTSTSVARADHVHPMPATYPPSAHKSTHAIGGADALTPADIGAVKNTSGVPELLADVLANRPAAGVVGRLFLATDKGEIYRDNGTGWDLAAASRDGLAAHLAETVITDNKNINVPADYPTIQAALDSLKKAWIPHDVTVTIQVAAGTYNHTSPIIVDHPCGLHIEIIGATPVTTTITGVGTITGAAGNWSVPIQVQSTASIAAGDYVIIKNTTGTGDHYAFWGIWKVISVDSTTQITVQNTHRKSTFPSATLNGGTVIALKTILWFANSCGVLVPPGSGLGLINNIALVGDGSANNYGLWVGYNPTNQNAGAGAFVLCGTNFGVNGFGQGGLVAAYSGSIWAKYVASSGNGLHGYYAYMNGVIRGDFSVASGNGQRGFSAERGGAFWVSSATACGNGNVGFWATIGGFIAADSSVASNNTNLDYYAWLESGILVTGYIGTPTFSPAVNTVGNANAIIST
ncbi:MAG: hypothetical protein ACPL5F_04925 [Moorellaceae bacterium]